MRPLVLAAALLAVPVAAQSTEDLPPPPAPELSVETVDPALVGEWTLDEVVAAGTLGTLDVTLEGMACDFDADGTAHVEMALVQDLDPIAQARAFSFATADGQIVIADDDNVRYTLLSDGRLQLEAEGGLIVRLVRADA